MKMRVPSQLQIQGRGPTPPKGGVTNLDSLMHWWIGGF